MLFVCEEHALHSRYDAFEEGGDEFVKSVCTILSSTKSGSSKFFYRSIPSFIYIKLMTAVIDNNERPVIN